MSFRTYARNIIPFTLITALLYIPIFGYTTWWLSAEHSGSFSGEFMKYVGVTSVLGLFLNAFVSATLTYGVVKELQGQRASIGACLAVGFKRMLPVSGVAILAGLAMVGGFILLVIPGFIVLCMLYVSTPASVIEAPGVVGALRRSRELTAGHKGQIFGIVFLLGLMSWAADKILQAVMPVTASNLHTFMYAAIGIKVVLGALGSVVAAVAYYALRADKEGTSANELAAVFE
jgi:hypothetical protein